MALNVAQLEQIKDALIESGNSRIPKVVRQLFPDEKIIEVRKQMFETYGRDVVMGWMNIPSKSSETDEEKVTRLQKNLDRINQRKAKLEEELTKLQ